MTDLQTSYTADELAEFKRQAAEYALQFVRSGMVLGLGSGSTAILVTREIGARLQRGAMADILAWPTSQVVAVEAHRMGIPLCPGDQPPKMDLAIDGADEVDPQLNLIKGGGGALLREKIIAQNTAREIIIVDETKLSPRLGTRHALPIEILPFGWKGQFEFLESLGASVTLRLTSSGTPYRTDQDNWILDCQFGPIAQPDELAQKIQARAGIVEHGLFLALTSDLIVAGPGGVQHLTRQ